MYDVAIIGAGVAGVTSALTSVAFGSGAVALIDKGRRHERRFCHVDNGRKCTGCDGICNVVNGFGGSLHYGDGVKLVRPPSGRRLYELIGLSATVSAELTLMNAFSPILQNLKFKTTANSVCGINVKQQEIAEVSENDLARIIDAAYEKITGHPNVNYFSGREVLEIKKCNDYFNVRVLDLSSLDVTEISASRVVVATGRGGYTWWSNEIRNLDVDFEEAIPSIGVRFECPPGSLRNVGINHPDFKMSKEVHGIKYKTFCFCAGSGGGRIKFVNYGDFTLLDGHVVLQPPAVSDNFALLAQLKKQDGAPYPMSYVKSNILPMYQGMRSDRPGMPVSQLYTDFINKRVTVSSMVDIWDRIGFHTGVVDYAVGNLSTLFPAHIFEGYVTVAEDLFSKIMNETWGDESRSKVVLHGLVLEGMWDKITLTDKLETTIPGLFVAGDCTGLAQGAYPSAIAGVITGRAVAS